MQERLPQGWLDIRAARARMGHRKVWSMMVGPETFLSLEGVEISVRIGREEALGIEAEQAQMRCGSVEMAAEKGRPEPRLCLSGREPVPCALVPVRSASGEIGFREAPGAPAVPLEDAPPALRLVRKRDGAPSESLNPLRNDPGDRYPLFPFIR